MLDTKISVRVGVLFRRRPSSFLQPGNVVLALFSSSEDFFPQKRKKKLPFVSGFSYFQNIELAEAPCFWPRSCSLPQVL
jgi:hypothetical protein